MEGHSMTSGIIPIRQSDSSCPVKLPKRYEKAALGNTANSKHQKNISNISCRETVSDRLEDLVRATVWVKQELILLRQHDILLKRQFFNIHHSIRTLQPKNTLPIVPLYDQGPPSCKTANTAIKINVEEDQTLPAASSTPFSPISDSSTSKCSPYVLHLPHTYSDYHLQTLLTRPTGSDKPTSGNNDDDSDEESDGGDLFYEMDYFRPRTISMKTSRDLAALARRRGSKDLI